MSELRSPGADRMPRHYWLLAALLVAYVAACTGGRDNHWQTDGWEHHRAFKALTEDLWHPGNPTYAIETPSARYSPYSVFWASICRLTGLDPWDAMSLAATVNTAVLVLAVPFLLGRFDEARCATSALIVMVGLYGGIPGTTGSYALADLPWHQVNFSAASFVWALVLLGVFRGHARGEWGAWTLPVILALSALTMLDHGMVGAWGQASLWLFVLTAPPGRRPRLAATLLALQVGTLLVCLAWPWYDFRAALSVKAPARLVPYGIQNAMTFQWCIPAVILAVLAMALRGREAIRTFLIGGYLCYLAGLSIYVLPIQFPLLSSVSRFPMPGLIYLHASLGILAHEAGLFRPGSWPGRVRTLFRGERDAVTRAASEVVLAATLAYFLAPQVVAILREPYLMRPYLARSLGKEDKQLDLLPRFRSLLKGVGRRDVVLSDEDTMWCVPSINGRIVHALHAELFVPEQEDLRRQLDSEAFFEPGTSDRERLAILREYGVRWLILNRRFQDPAVVEHLLRDKAVVRTEGFLTLMDAGRWAKLVEAERAEAGPAATTGRQR